MSRRHGRMVQNSARFHAQLWRWMRDQVGNTMLIPRCISPRSTVPSPLASSCMPPSPVSTGLGHRVLHLAEVPPDGRGMRTGEVKETGGGQTMAKRRSTQLSITSSLICASVMGRIPAIG
jgi:hypothetical protein